MASFAILLIPASQDYLPSDKQLSDTKSLLENFFPDRGNEVEVNQYPNSRFVTQEDGFDHLFCPLCKTEIDRFEDEYDEWWFEFEHQLKASNKPLQEVIKMPCCGDEITASQLKFQDDAAFTKLLIRLAEPGDAVDVDDSQLKALENAFGSNLIQMTEVKS